jgi:hypothetical protein
MARFIGQQVSKLFIPNCMEGKPVRKDFVRIDYYIAYISITIYYKWNSSRATIKGK